MKINWFGILVALTAFLIAGTAAYFSIFGLSKLFAGAVLPVIIMSSVLESGKLVCVSYLNRYWKNIGTFLKIYLIFSVFILMVITSAGIYGFLTNAYQQTANNYDINTQTVKIIELKKERFVQDRIETQIELRNIKNDIIKKNSTLSELRSNTDIKTTWVTSKKIKDTKSELDELINYRNSLNTRFDVVSDSITRLDERILNENNKNTTTSELGPLKYLSDLTGKPMNKIINWFVLLLIFVFDPLAISLVIATNNIFKKNEITTIPNSKLNNISDYHSNKKVDEKEIILQPVEQEPIITHEPTIQPRKTSLMNPDGSISV